MKTKREFSVLLSTVLLATFSSGASYAEPSPQPSAIAPVKDQRAMAELKKMSDALTVAKSMSFEAASMTPIQAPNEQWIHIFSTAKVKMQRPNKLFVETGGDAFPEKIYFDGKTYSINSAETKLYTQISMPGKLDEMLAEAAQKGGQAFPFADVLLSDPLESWTKDLDGAMYIGESNRNGEKLQHFAMTAKEVDWEVWVDAKTHLPRTVFVKYTGEHKAPSVLIEFTKWKLNAKVSSSDFVFKPAAGAQNASFKAPEGEGSK